MCFGCSKEQSNWDGSFDYLQHMFWLIYKKNSFQLPTLYLDLEACHVMWYILIIDCQYMLSSAYNEMFHWNEILAGACPVVSGNIKHLGMIVWPMFFVIVGSMFSIAGEITLLWSKLWYLFLLQSWDKRVPVSFSGWCHLLPMATPIRCQCTTVWSKGNNSVWSGRCKNVCD